MLIFLNCLSLCIFSLGGYLVWFNKKNIFSQFFIGLCIVGYVIPCIIFDFDIFVSNDIIYLYTLINIIGASFFLLGLWLGNKWRKIDLIDFVLNFSLLENKLNNLSVDREIIKFSRSIYLLCLVILICCFLLMGFVPMFAADPFIAKQFKGPYHDSYQRVAFFYRTAKQFIEILMPIILIDFYFSRSKYSLFMFLIGLFLIFSTMSRGETVMGLLVIITIIIVLKHNNVTYIFFLVGLILFFSLGSGLWSLLAYLFPNSGFGVLSTEGSIFENIANGAPDISDQLKLLSAFEYNHTSYTYGLTFFGALIPYNFRWNPSVWTLTVLNQTDDISEISSGGLRVNVAMWGYFSFGWIGVGVLSFCSAFFTGYITKKMKRIIYKLDLNLNGVISYYLVYFCYTFIATIFINFYFISIYSLPAFFFYGLLIYLIKRESKSISGLI